MTIHAVVEKLQGLRSEDLEIVSRFVDGLKRVSSTERKTVIGAFEDNGVPMTAADFEAARRDMWNSFPRDFAKD